MLVLLLLTATVAVMRATANVGSVAATQPPPPFVTITKLGACPTDPSWDSSVCHDIICVQSHCRTDFDCDNAAKCCTTRSCCPQCEQPTVAAPPTFVPPKPASEPKRGRCPVQLPPAKAGDCRAKCSSDENCPGTGKCCPDGCGRDCQAPVFPIDKPGSCPHISPGEPGSCRIGCAEDGDCNEASLCCPTGCGQVCRAPVVTSTDAPPKSGTCPVVKPGTFGPCVEVCTWDGECKGTAKCCSNGCGHTCQAPVVTATTPVPVKPGRCPMKVPNFSPDCADRCSWDGECQGTAKCCYNGCGHGCAAVVVPVTNPGSCPTLQPGQFFAGDCRQDCIGDEDCDESEKCCSSGCVRTCV